MPKRHVVRLTDDQRADLEGRFCGRLTLRERNRVQVLLRTDAGDTDEEIADAVDICAATVVAIRKRFAADGLEAALGERPRSGGPAKFDGKVEAAVVAVACSPVPAGRAPVVARAPVGVSARPATTSGTPSPHPWDAAITRASVSVSPIWSDSASRRTSSTRL